MKRCYIIYSANTQLTLAHTPTLFSNVWIRVEYHEGTLESALDAAKPLKGEVVLNSVEHWEQK